MSALVKRLVRQGVLPAGQPVVGPWPGTVQAVEVSSGDVPTAFDGAVVSMMLSSTHLAMVNAHSRSVGLPLHRIAVVERTVDRDVVLLVPTLLQSLYISWRPIKSKRLGDPGRELWTRWQSSLSQLSEPEALAHDLLAGVGLHWRQRWADAHASWLRAADAEDPFVAALAELSESSGDGEAALAWYRRVVEQTPHAAPGSDLEAVVGTATERLAHLNG